MVKSASERKKSKAIHVCISSSVMSVCVCVCACVCSASIVSNSLRNNELWPARLLYAWNFPGKNTGVGCHFLLQGELEGLNSHVSCIGRRILYHCITTAQVMMDSKTPLKLCQCFLRIFHYPIPNPLNTSALFLKVWWTKRVLQAYIVFDSMEEKQLIFTIILISLPLWQKVKRN